MLRLRALSTGLVLALAVLAACGGAGRWRRPVPLLSNTPNAALEMNEIRRMWGDLEGRDREALRVRIRQFLAKYPNDGATPLARTYLTFILLSDGDFSEAKAQLDFLETIPMGATRDFSTVARARLLRLTGRAKEALELLAPLAGKMVDRHALELFQEEITLDAVAAHRDYEAIAYMDSWLRHGDEEEREEARRKIPEALATMSPQVLEASLRAMRATAARGPGAGGYSVEMQRFVASQLAGYAVETGDARLAQWLTDPDAGAPVLASDAGVLVSELATRNRSTRAVSGRTIGLVLPTGSSSLRDSAADAARGAAWALDLPRAAKDSGDKSILVTRDDGGRADRIELVLDDLASDGAAVILAGFDPDSADRALRWAETNGVPVITLAAPRSAYPGRFGFVVGEPPSSSIEVLSDALLARRETKVALVTDVTTVVDVARVVPTRPKLAFFQPAPCELGAPAASGPRFPLPAWEKAGVRTWLVAGPEPCARDVLHEVGELRGALVALTLEGIGAYERAAAAKVLSAAAGSLPVRQEAAPTRRGAENRGTSSHDAGPSGAVHAGGAIDPDIQRFMISFSAKPTWFTALSRDAAVLARRAVVSLPTDATSRADDVTARRETARKALEGARAPLWTSEESGFSSGGEAAGSSEHTVKRTVKVVELH
ncbi:ABC transporter substrate-binding protein [Pendulispora albinea]|uniref:ABC transporter substrate-binding protein n=1 Tax=Pendulispora albinea TaxID=2741071 RepID=A0ABZ2LZH9_9BACT